MSTTTFCRVSVARKKATSTTKVAPCMFCAGPKNGSGRLWAIMIRSRTSTAYMVGSPARSGLRVANDGGEACGAGRQDARKLARGIFEGDLLGDQGIERRHRQQTRGGFDAPAIVPARAAARCHLPDLRRHELQAAAVECPTQLGCNRSVAVPAHLDDGAFQPRAIDGGGKAGRRGAGVEDDVGVLRRLLRAGKPAPERFRYRPPAFIHIYRRHLGAW